LAILAPEPRDAATTSTVALEDLTQTLNEGPGNIVSLLGIQVTKQLRSFAGDQVTLQAQPPEVSMELVLGCPHMAVGGADQLRNAHARNKKAIRAQTSRSKFQLFRSRVAWRRGSNYNRIRDYGRDVLPEKEGDIGIVLGRRSEEEPGTRSLLPQNPKKGGQETQLASHLDVVQISADKRFGT
jgi:hypothetical protein